VVIAMEIVKLPPSSRDREPRGGVPRRRPAPPRRSPGVAPDESTEAESNRPAGTGTRERRIDVQA
jgi:hypothetical protein